MVRFDGPLSKKRGDVENTQSLNVHNVERLSYDIGRPTGRLKSVVCAGKRSGARSSKFIGVDSKLIFSLSENTGLASYFGISNNDTAMEISLSTPGIAGPNTWAPWSKKKKETQKIVVLFCTQMNWNGVLRGRTVS